jgi:hypothetical protein
MDDGRGAPGYGQKPGALAPRRCQRVLSMLSRPRRARFTVAQGGDHRPKFTRNRENVVQVIAYGHMPGDRALDSLLNFFAVLMTGAEQHIL